MTLIKPTTFDRIACLMVCSLSLASSVLVAKNASHHGWCHCLFSQNLCLQSGGLGPCQVQAVMAKGSVRTKVAAHNKTMELGASMYISTSLGGWLVPLPFLSEPLPLEVGKLARCQVQV